MGLSARDIMTTDVFVLRAGDDIPYAAKALVEHNIGGAPVTDETGRLVGIVSESDLVIRDATLHYPTYIRLLDSFIALGQRHFEDVLRKVTAAKVSQLMTVEVVTGRTDTSVEQLATLMTDYNVSRIPIVDDNGKPIGMVTKTDIVRSMGTTGTS